MHDVWSFTVNRRRAFHKNPRYRAKHPNAAYSILKEGTTSSVSCEIMIRHGADPEHVDHRPSQENRARLLRRRNTSDTLDLYSGLVVEKNRFEKPST